MARRVFTVRLLRSGRQKNVCRCLRFLRQKRCSAKEILIIILKSSNKLPSKPGSEWGAVKGGNKSFPGLVRGQEGREVIEGHSRSGGIGYLWEEDLESVFTSF